MNKPAAGVDPRAATRWEPISPVVTNIATLNFVEVTSSRLESRRALADLVLTVVVSAAVIVPIAFLPTMVTGELQATAAAGIAAVAMALVALRMAYGTPTHVFDRASGQYWYGRGTADAPGRRNACGLASILAIQLLFKRAEGKRFRPRARRSRLAGYEINLVLRDGKRIHVANHGQLPALRREAAKLARFLNCKVWDGAGNWPAEFDPLFVRVGEEAQRPPATLWQQAVVGLMGLSLAVGMAAAFFTAMQTLYPDPPEQQFLPRKARPDARPAQARAAPPPAVVVHAPAAVAPDDVPPSVEEPPPPAGPVNAPVEIRSVGMPVTAGGQLVIKGANFSAPENHEAYIQRNGVKVVLEVLRTSPYVLIGRIPADPRLSTGSAWQLVVATKQPAFASDPYALQFE